MLKPLTVLPFLALPALAQRAESAKVPPMTFPTPSMNFHAPGIAVPPGSVPLGKLMMTEGCPVSIAASPGGGLPQAVTVTSDEDAALPMRPGGTGVHVRLLPHFQKIEHYSVEVSYRVFDGAYSISTHLPPVQRKRFELTSTGFRALERNLLVAPHAEVLRVRVLSVVYADGTTWEGDEDSHCSVRPSRMLLVATR